MPSSTTSDRILDAALASFAGRGYEATSLDAAGQGLELTKQSILYWFPSKDALLEAVIARSAADLSAALESALRGAGEGWDRVEAVVRSVFRLAARQPELLGLLREVGRLGPPAATQMTLALEPLVQRASSFLEAEMDAGHHAAPRPATAPPGHLLDRDRHGHRGRGAAGAGGGADGPLAGAPPGRRAPAAAFGVGGRTRRADADRGWVRRPGSGGYSVGLGIFFRGGAFGV